MPDSVAAQPKGLLLHETTVYLFRPHLGMRKCRRNIDSLEHWTRAQVCGSEAVHGVQHLMDPQRCQNHRPVRLLVPLLEFNQ